MSKNIVLYHAAPSFFSQIARLALVEKGIEFTGREVDILMRMDHISPEYVKIHPDMTVPALVCGGTIVPGSDQILSYLEQHHPQPTLMGLQSDEIVETERWLELFYSFPIEELTFSSFFQRLPLMKMAFKWKIGSVIRRLEQLSERNPDHKADFLRKADHMRSRKAILLASETYMKSITKLEEVLKAIDENLDSGGPWISGSRYSYADVFATCFLARVAMVGKAEAFLGRPNLELYWNRVKDRPSFEAANIWDRFQPKQFLRELSGSIPGFRSAD